MRYIYPDFGYNIQASSSDISRPLTVHSRPIWRLGVFTDLGHVAPQASQPGRLGMTFTHSDTARTHSEILDTLGHDPTHMGGLTMINDALQHVGVHTIFEMAHSELRVAAWYGNGFDPQLEDTAAWRAAHSAIVLGTAATALRALGVQPGTTGITVDTFRWNDEYGTTSYEPMTQAAHFDELHQMYAPAIAAYR